MQTPRPAGSALALIGVLLLSACRQPVTYGSRVTIGAGDRLDARHPQSGEHAQRDEGLMPGEAGEPAAGAQRQ